MTDAAFDTLAATRNLEAVGVTRAYAEAIADTVRQAAVADRDALATKAYITHLEDKLETKADLYRALWMQTGAIVGAIVAAVVALVKLLS